MNLIKEIIEPFITGYLGILMFAYLAYNFPAIIITKIFYGKYPEKVGTSNLLKSFVFSTVFWILLILLVRMNLSASY